MRDIVTEAVGKWHGIYSALGIEVGDGKHCACPVCGGKDRFRMDNKEGRGSWFCSQCAPHAGDGFLLIQNVLGIDFKQAVEEVKSIIGGVTEKSNIPKESKITPELLRVIFVGSAPAKTTCPVGNYLSNRGIEYKDAKLRYHPKCYEPETKTKIPAMLAVFTSADGKALTMHRTYLDGLGGKSKISKPKKILPGLGNLSGGAIRLCEPDDGMIAVAEGIETALAVTEMMNIPCWSVVSTTLMEAFEPPNGIDTVYIMADNDANFAGQKAAYVLANRLALKKIKVSVMIPAKIGADFLDEHNAQK